MAGNEPVTSPDQHRPGNLKLVRIGGVMAILVLLVMLLPSQGDWVDDAWLIGIAGLIAVAMVADWVLRRNGLRR